MAARKSKAPDTGSAPRLLSGGNPQIARADGGEAVAAYIAAMPGWKSAVGREIDEIVSRAVPGVRKAVKWNSPFYGVAGHGWFLALHCFTGYVKVTFFAGARLDPPPPEPSKVGDTRYLHIREGGGIHDGGLDAAQFERWVRAASRLPGGEGLGPC